jgi:hypothetical protein
MADSDRILVNETMPTDGLSGRSRVMLLTALAAVFIPVFLKKGTLEENIPWWLIGIGVLVGLAAGLGLCAVIFKSGAKPFERTRSGLGMIAAPIFGAVLGSYYARVGFEYWHFAFYQPQKRIVLALITEASNGRGGPFAHAATSPVGRDMMIDISGDLLDHLDPIRQPGRDCLWLSEEVGREGVRRVILPNKFDQGLGLDHLRRCPRGFAWMGVE